MTKAAFAGYLLLALLLAAGFAITPQLILAAPIPSGGGFIQKIFYYHVPVAWVAFLSVFVSGVGSIAFLARRARWGEEVANAAAELVVVFGLLVLLTGPLWARKAWGTWWVWDARITATLLLWLIFVVYHLVQRHAGPAGRRLAAGLAVFGALDVPIIWVAVSLWRTQHPQTTYVPSLGPEAGLAFFLSLALFTVLWIALFWVRLAYERTRNRVDELHVAAAEAGIEE
jgi:heme exporter protein C